MCFGSSAEAPWYTEDLKWQEILCWIPTPSPLWQTYHPTLTHWFNQRNLHKPPKQLNRN